MSFSEGIVYRWVNIKNNMIYIGSHKGDANDKYVGSGVYFLRAYNKNPKYFKREILYKGQDYREVEEIILQSVDAKNNNKYYNLKNKAIGGWDHVNSCPDILKKKNKAISKSKKCKYFKHLEYDKSGKNNPNYGKKHKEESIKKMSAAKIGNSNPAKKVIEMVSGKMFNSVSECAEYYKITQPTMTHHLKKGIIKRGKLKNKIFKYVT